MANRLYNKQVTPKGYAEGGPARRSTRPTRKQQPGKRKKETLGEKQFKTTAKAIDTNFAKGQRLQKAYKGASPTIKADLKKRFKGMYKPGAILAASRRDATKTFKRGGRVKKMGGGSLKAVNPKTQKGLSKLPTEVRNKMGYMKKGGKVHGK
jgi:hypothetical protein